MNNLGGIMSFYGYRAVLSQETRTLPYVIPWLAIATACTTGLRMGSTHLGSPLSLLRSRLETIWLSGEMINSTIPSYLVLLGRKQVK